MPGEHGPGCNCQDEPSVLGLGQAVWLNKSVLIDQVEALNNETDNEH